MAKRSDIISSSASPVMNLFRKGLLHGAGIDTDKLATRPLIAIANSHTELTTGHSHLDKLGYFLCESCLKSPAWQPAQSGR